MKYAMTLAPVNQPTATLNNTALPMTSSPEMVLDFAHRAAKALTAVVNSKPKKCIINGEQFISFEDWQTIARFYNTSIGVSWTRSVIKKDSIFGYEARAVAYKDGNIISSAEASCSREEKAWANKPTFQIKSMSQTRAMAKCLRSVFGWVVVLAGYKPTPAEEIIDTVPSQETVAPKESNNDWVENKITTKQEVFLRQLVVDVVEDEEEREKQLSNLNALSRADASELIQQLISEKKVNSY
jgi:hypothetical protein